MRGRPIISFLLIWLVWSMLTCCSSSDNNNNSIPLPVAWPRMALTTSDSMITVNGTPVEVRMNPMAKYEIVSTNPPGLTIRYPDGGTDIYFTFIEPESPEQRSQIIESRLERMSLNLNGVQAKTYHSSSSDGFLVVAMSGTQTPVQLLADLPDYVVTATAFIHDPRVSQSYDSIRPLIDILQHDMSKALPNINFR